MPTEWPTPLALIVPVAPPPLTLPPETTTVDVVVVPQPTAVTSHTPSNLLTLPLPPPLFRLHRARCLPQAGKGFLIIRDTPACAARLSQRSARHAGPDQEGDECIS